MKHLILPLIVALSLPATALGEGGAVPNLVGLQGSEARAALERAGMVYAAAAQGEPTTSPAKVGTVAKQSPAAGTAVPSAAPVTVTLYVLAAPAASAEGNARGGAVHPPEAPAPEGHAGDGKGTVLLPGKW